MKALTLLIFSTLLALPTVARADTYLYDITLVDRAQTVFETTSLITTQTTITNFISCTTGGPGSGGVPLTPCDKVTITPNFAFDSFEMYEEADIEFYDGSVNTFGDTIIASVDFSTVGDHQFNSIDNITITDLSTVNATPEPSSLILLGTGALSMAGAIRRRVLRG